MFPSEQFPSSVTVIKLWENCPLKRLHILHGKANLGKCSRRRLFTLRTAKHYLGDARLVVDMARRTAGYRKYSDAELAAGFFDVTHIVGVDQPNVDNGESHQYSQPV